MGHESLVFEELLISTLAICENGIGETEPFEQVSLAFFDVCSETETLKKAKTLQMH